MLSSMLASDHDTVVVSAAPTRFADKHAQHVRVLGKIAVARAVILR